MSKPKTEFVFPLNFVSRVLIIITITISVQSEFHIDLLMVLSLEMQQYLISFLIESQLMKRSCLLDRK